MPEEPTAETPESEAHERPEFTGEIGPLVDMLASSDSDDAQRTQELPRLSEQAHVADEPVTSFEAPQQAVAQTDSSVPATVPAGSRIALIVSRGPSPLPASVPVGMPDVTGEAQGTALLRLQDQGLTIQVLHDRNSRLPRGYVVGQYPMAGGGVLPGADAVLMVSSGRSKLPAPDVMLPVVVGLPHTLAADTISSAGLVPRIVYDHDPFAAPGTVIEQIPNEATLALPLRRRGKGWAIAVAMLVLVAAIAGAVLFFNRPTSIPNLVGLSQRQAEQSARLAGFRLGSVSSSQTANPAEIGSVIGQAPPPGGTAPHGSAISLVVAGGQLLVPVPNLTGGSQPAAVKALQDAGFMYQVNYSFSSSVASGSVVAQAPVSGQRVPPGTTVGLTVSLGAQLVTVPSVIGQVRATAETALTSSGLGVAVASNYDSTTPAGQVIGQMPTVGTGVVPGSVVGLTVSRGVPVAGSVAATAPAVVSKTTAKAKSAIKARRMKSLVVQRTGTGKAKGIVVAQLPDQNAIVPRGSVIIIFVSDGK